MKRSTRRPAVTRSAGVSAAVLVLALSGCSAWAPQTIATPYEASDGSNGQIGGSGENGGVKLRNFLLVGTDEGAPAVLVGAVLNETTQPVEVAFRVTQPPGASDPAPAGEPEALLTGTVTAAPNVLTQVGTGEDAVRLQVRELPVAPGAVLTLEASTSAGGTTIDLPVLPRAREYATISPSPTRARATPSGSPEASQSPSVQVSPGAPEESTSPEPSPSE